MSKGILGPFPTSGLNGMHPPGTTPLVAMALMEMAVSKVCGKEGRGEQLSWAGSVGQPWPCPTMILTQQQQMSTMRRACSTPAVPTIQVSRRKRITPKMFCRQGRYTPMRVPMLGAYGAGGERGDGASEGPLIAWQSPPPGYSAREQAGEGHPKWKPGDTEGELTGSLCRPSLMKKQWGVGRYKT